MIEMEGSDIDELDGLVSSSQAPNLDIIVFHSFELVFEWTLRLMVATPNEMEPKPSHNLTSLLKRPRSLRDSRQSKKASKSCTK